MKKILALVLAVLMIVGSMVSVAAFEDVAADNKYAKAINELQTQKVIQGTSETTFTPDALVTRWQMALFMARAVSGITDDANWQVGAQLFTDCSQYLGAIQYCYAKGIIKGVTATTFAPDANITLRDGLIMAVRALGYEKEDEGLEASAKKYNVTGANYWVPYYQTADELGLLENLGDLSIVAPLTRAQTAQLIYNMLFTVVYAKNDANTNDFTLNDIAFGGKKIVDVDTTKNAWVNETPKYFFGTYDSIDEDEEEIEIAWYDDDGDIVTDIVEFEELEEYGIDTTKIDEYFGATLELINFPAAEDKDDEPAYGDYEYLTNFEKANVAELTKADFDFGDNGKVRIGSKTHYDSKNNTEDKKNEVVFYILDTAADDIDALTFEIVAASAFKAVKDYDAKAYDVDNDGYYEYVYINPLNIAVYEEASAKGAERCGVMSGVKDVTYTETPVEEDIFAYTYDAFTKTVTVKEVIEPLTGEITSYYSKTTKDDDNKDIVTGYVTIDGTKYTISDTNTTKFFYDIETGLGDLELGTAASLREQAGDAMYQTWEYFAYNGYLIDLVKESDEEEDENLEYIVVNDFVDFELKEYVVMSTLIDAEEEELKVNKIYEWDDVNGKWVVKYNFTKLGYSSLAEALKIDNIKGIYTYEEDADGIYKLYARDSFKYNMVDTDNQDGYIDNKTSLVFSSGKAIDAIDREHMFRLASDTKIYLIKDTGADGYEVETVKAKTSGTFSIPVDENTTFYADKVGYGDPDDDCDITHGVTSVLYIFAEDDAFDADDYSIVFVDAAIEEIEHGTAADFGFEEDEDAEDETKYVKFVADDNAYILSTFKAVEEIYMTFDDAKAAGYNLVPGVYLVDADGIVATNKENAPAVVELDDIKAGNNVFELKNGKVGFISVTLKAGEIDLYNFSDIRLPGCVDLLKLGADLTSTTDSLGAAVKTLKVRDYLVEADDESGENEVVSIIDKTNAKLVDYLEEDYANGATVIVVGNDKSDRNGDGVYANDWVAYPDNTLCGVIIDNLKLVD